MNPTPERETLVDLQRLLAEAGATVTDSRSIDHGTQYTISRGPENATVNVYRTGKTSTGGKSSALRTLLDDWRLSRGGKARGKTNGPADKDELVARPGAGPTLDGTPRVGSDEAGKGDYFGPLVVAGARVVGVKAAQKLREARVRDSKLLSVGEARRMGRRVMEELGPENVCVVVLGPREYEARRAAAGNNVNRLLAEVNGEIISRLGAETELFVVDEFARAARSYIEPLMPPGVRLEVRPRAEDHDAAVAAASVLARARFLEEIERLSELVGFALPLGATHVLEAARRVVGERGVEGLAEVAKIHFVTTERVLAANDERDGGSR